MSVGDFEGKQTGRSLYYREDQAARVDISKEFERFYADTSVQVESNKFDHDGASRIPEYAI